MRVDPRRNLAATAAGVLGVALGVLPSLLDQYAPFPPARIALVAAGVVSLVAGAWPSRRVRFALLLVVVPALAIVGVLAMFSIGIPVLLTGAVAAYGLLIEYAREGRD